MIKANEEVLLLKVVFLLFRQLRVKKNYMCRSVITVTISVMLSKYSVSLMVKVKFLLQLTL